MRHAAAKPHMLLIEPSPVVAVLSSVEFDATGCEWTLAGSAAEALAWAAALFGPYGPAQPGAILVSLEPDAAFDGAGLAAELRSLMRQGLLRDTPIFGMASRVTAAVEASAIAAGCQLLRAPLRPAAAQFLAALVRDDSPPVAETRSPIVVSAA